MARNHARIYLSVWSDPDFLGLSVAEQHAYWTLLVSPDLSYAGVAPLLPQRFATIARDATPAKFSRALTGLERAGLVVLDAQTGEVACRSYVRYDGIIQQPNVLCGAIKAWGKIHSERIRDVIREEFERAFNEGFPEGFPEGFGKAFARSFPEGFPEGFGEAFANSPSPFPLPPSKHASLGKQREGSATMHAEVEK